MLTFVSMAEYMCQGTEVSWHVREPGGSVSQSVNEHRACVSVGLRTFLEGYQRAFVWGPAICDCAVSV